MKSVTEEKKDISDGSCEMRNSDVDMPNPRTVANPPTSKVTDILKNKNDFDGVNVNRDENYDRDSSNPSTDIPSRVTISQQGDGCETFSVSKYFSMTLESKIWQDLFDRRITSKSQKNNTVTVTLPPDWTSAISKALSALLPYCCLNFKRHKLYKNSDKLFKCWYYCTIEGCELKGTAILNPSLTLSMENVNTALKHVKSGPKSFKSRNIKGEERKSLANEVAEMPFPSKVYHRRLAALDENSFQMGNLKNVPQSKNVIKQCKYEDKQNSRIDDSIIVSLQELKSLHERDLSTNIVPGFVQFTSFDPLTIGLWSEKDIEMFRQMSQKHSFFVDGTGTIATKLNGKEIFYFAFLSFNRLLRVEPVPHLEILTDRASFNTLEFVLSIFLEDVKKKYGHRSHTVPILCTTDCSFPILKSLVSAFNKESLEEYLQRSYKICCGEASVSELPSEKNKTFVHISLCHLMKAICYKIDKSFKVNKSFLKYSISLLANAGNLNDIFDICTSIFTILLSQKSASCENANNALDLKASNMESFKIKSLEPYFSSEDKPDQTCTSSKINLSKFPETEETYLQQSKRSIYYQKCKDIFKNIKSSNAKIISNTDEEGIDSLNPLYSPSFAKYLLDNWCGLLPLWTSLHLGDQGRHGSSIAYQYWSEKYGKKECVMDPPKTQGIIEFHQKSVKHISLNSKRERLDEIVQNLFICKKSKLRQYEISESRKKGIKKPKKKLESLSSKIVSEKWSKRKCKQSKGPGFYQRDKIVKKVKKKLEDWEKLRVIPSGGQHILPSGKTIRMHSTCALDSFLEIPFFFYALNLHQMKCLFACENNTVGKICNVVQLLLSNNFDSAKYFWYTDICGLLPDKSGTLDGFGTDKQIVMHHISSMYCRNYDYTCSSNNCPSHVGNFQLTTDTVNDMTLHQPISLNNNENIIEKSIELWELGSAPQAEISCNNMFDSKPDHTDYISYDDHGKTHIKCSGWRQPKNLTFDDPPPFLVFDISTIFRAEIKNLDILPHQVNIYGQIYRLGGITSFVANRSHYVAYILHKNIFYHYDGLPSSNPKFEVQTDVSIKGDISLLCYFPCDSLFLESTSVHNTRTELSPEKSVDEIILEEPSESNCNKDIGESDFLLAKALSQIEKDETDLYKKPRGKNYRQSYRQAKNLPDLISLAHLTPIPDLPPRPITPPTNPMTSTSESSESDAEDEEVINTDLISFISKNKSFILSLISDSSSNYHSRSDRLSALQRLDSISEFEKNAKKEMEIIRREMHETLGGKGLNICEPYISHIFENILQESRPPNSNDITDYGGSFLVPIKIKKFGSVFKTIEFIILPEILSKYIMEQKKLVYKEASNFMYGYRLSQSPKPSGSVLS